jgi:hypothetical protein
MTEAPTKPVDPGPCASEAERSKYAQDNAKWLAEHPEHEQASVEPHLPGAAGVTAPLAATPAEPSHDD